MSFFFYLKISRLMCDNFHHQCEIICFWAVHERQRRAFFKNKCPRSWLKYYYWHRSQENARGRGGNFRLSLLETPPTTQKLHCNSTDIFHRHPYYAPNPLLPVKCMGKRENRERENAGFSIYHSASRFTTTTIPVYCLCICVWGLSNFPPVLRLVRRKRLTKHTFLLNAWETPFNFLEIAFAELTFSVTIT